MSKVEQLMAEFDVYMLRADAGHLARLVPNAKISEQEYNLSVYTYVAQEDAREKLDIITLNAEIEKIVAREDELCREIDRTFAEIERLDL